MANNMAVYGIYQSREHAEEAILAMQAAGFRNQDISVLLADNPGTKDFGHEKHTKAPEGGAAGGATGVMLGGALGWLVGIGALAIPGLGPFIAAGPVMAALAGAGAGGVVGGLMGSLVGLGVPEYEAKRYEGRVRSGGVLLSVHCEDDHWVRRAKEMLRHTGAEDIASSHEGRGSRASRNVPERDTVPPMN